MAKSLIQEHIPANQQGPSCENRTVLFLSLIHICLDYVIYRPADRAAVDMVFSKGMNGEALTVEEVELFKTCLLYTSRCV